MGSPGPRGGGAHVQGGRFVRCDPAERPSHRLADRRTRHAGRRESGAGHRRREGPRALGGGNGDHPRSRDVAMRAPKAAGTIFRVLVVSAMSAVSIAQTGTDAATASAGEGYFSLVTARNLLGEIGPKGHASSGFERANAAPCP